MAGTFLRWPWGIRTGEQDGIRTENPATIAVATTISININNPGIRGTITYLASKACIDISRLRRPVFIHVSSVLSPTRSG